MASVSCFQGNDRIKYKVLLLLLTSRGLQPSLERHPQRRHSWWSFFRLLLGRSNALRDHCYSIVTSLVITTLHLQQRWFQICQIALNVGNIILHGYLYHSQINNWLPRNIVVEVHIVLKVWSRSIRQEGKLLLGIRILLISSVIKVYMDCDCLVWNMYNYSFP